jgi:hypothetical protein
MLRGSRRYRLTGTGAFERSSVPGAGAKGNSCR